MHYSQQPPTFTLEQHARRTPEGALSGRLVHARLQGFITAPVLDSALSQLEHGLGARVDDDTAPPLARSEGSVAYPHGDGDAESIPAALLCDVSEVSGYGADAPRMAQKWLARAEQSGVHRIAFVAHSSVLRTTVELLKSRTRVDLGIFSSEAGARDWLERT